MAGFVHALSSRKEALEKVAASLGFPWKIGSKLLPLRNSLGKLLAEDIRTQEAAPAFSRSLRDGYAVRSADVIGASSSSLFFWTCGLMSLWVCFRCRRDFPIPLRGFIREGYCQRDMMR